MDNNKKCDVRVVKTKRAIRNAFIKLLSGKPYESITVKDIATEACVDRKTVYNYYGGVHDIRAEVENELAALIDRATDRFETGNVDYYSIFRSIAQMVTDNLDLYEYITLIDINSDITRKIVSVMRDRICDILRAVPVEDCDIELISDCIISTAVTACQYWFNSARSRSLEELLLEVGRFIIGGARDFVKR